MGPGTRSVPFIAALAFGVLAVGTANAGVLDTVKQRKMLQCGVNPGLPGFAAVDGQDHWTGFDVDYCRAIAGAVLGDGRAVKFVPLTTKERFKALQNGAVDVLVRDTAWTMARDTSFGLTFAGINYYNGQGFMVPKALGVDSALQLTGARVCVETGSATEIAVTAYFKAHSMSYVPVPMENDAKQKSAYESGLCNVYTGDTVSLYGARVTLREPEGSIVLPEVVSKEPYGLLVKQGDERWLALVKWVHFALLDAEELEITSENVDALKDSENGDVRQFLGVEGALGKGIGLDNAWAANAVRAVGNYGEVFDRNLGMASKLQIPRGLNALWTKGGLQFAPAIR